jgi:hypothetical protein
MQGHPFLMWMVLLTLIFLRALYDLLRSDALFDHAYFDATVREIARLQDVEMAVSFWHS